MTIRERILARADLAAARAARDLDALAAGLNAENLTEIAECWVDALGILNRCSSGKSIMRKLKGGAGLDAVIEVAWRALVTGKGLDFGAASTRDSIDEMAGLIDLTLDEVAELKALAARHIVVDRFQVEAAMFNPDGTEK